MLICSCYTNTRAHARTQVNALTEALGRLAPLRVVWKLQQHCRPTVPKPSNILFVGVIPLHQNFDHETKQYPVLASVVRFVRLHPTPVLI